MQLTNSIYSGLSVYHMYVITCTVAELCTLNLAQNTVSTALIFNDTDVPNSTIFPPGCL